MSISHLTPLLLGLKKGEVLMLLNYYRSMATRNESQKRLILLEFIIKNPEASDVEACQKLYGSKPHSAYSQLKKRLREDAMNILLLQDSKSRFNSPFAQAEFEVRRKIIEGDILISRGISQEGIAILNEAVQKAEKFELFAEQIMANELLMSHFTAYKNIKLYQKYQDKITQAQQNLSYLLQAKNDYHKILIPHLFKLEKAGDYEQFAHTSAQKLKEMYEQTKAIKIAYYYYYISILHHNLEKNYPEALKQAQKFLQLNKNEKAINTKRAVAGAHLQLSFIQLQLKQYAKSSQEAGNALKQFKTGLMNELTTLELLFLSQFYNQEEEPAKKTLQQALSHPKLNNNKLLPAKWHYYRVCFLFQQKKFDAANIAMNYCSFLLEDKTGWLYGYRIMDILLILENNDTFLADNKIEALSKIIGKQKIKANQRAKIITKILVELMRKHYDFKATAKSQKINLELLAHDKTHHHWEPMGYELIRFEKWYADKLKRK